MKNSFNFEKQVIDVILNIIKDNQVYLTQKENLPQLAKLGYMYNSLWYAGRICYGYAGLIRKSRNGQCEDNPKYKIEMCEPQTPEINNLIYDAWGMHVSEKQLSWETFSNIVLHGKELTELEVKLLKPNKTFDEWVEIMTDKNYPYPYSSRKGVADYLLCVIGNAHGFKDGCVIREASGADQDHTLYGDWENAKFRNDIDKKINKLLALPQVQECVQTAHEYIKDYYEQREKEKFLNRLDSLKFLVDKLKDEGLLTKDVTNMEELNEAIELVLNTDPIEHPIVQEVYQKYYPICDYSIITMIDENSHESYMKIAIEICEDILAHKQEEEQNNVQFAKKFMKKFGHMKR